MRLSLFLFLSSLILLAPLAGCRQHDETLMAEAKQKAMGMSYEQLLSFYGTPYREVLDTQGQRSAEYRSQTTICPETEEEWVDACTLIFHANAQNDIQRIETKGSYLECVQALQDKPKDKINRLPCRDLYKR